MIYLLILLPFLGLIITLFSSYRSEKPIAFIAFTVTILHSLVTLGVIGYWALGGKINEPEITIYHSGNYTFFLSFYFDYVSAVYLFTGSLLTSLVTFYSVYYLHLEKGYKRFFNGLLLFFLGYNIVILAGNFEIMFVGWEILGISSFLLIAFYRDRYLPVANAIKVFSIYRVGDVGLILVMWLSHHLWHENITFDKLHNTLLLKAQLAEHSTLGIAIAVFILLASVVKSAQFPFSSWIARAMEGPSPSSAIFYGSLSVHMGAFLLLRTHPFWENLLFIKILVGVIGVITAVLTNAIARVQPSAKGQIAYSSASQIGIIFLEIALGLEYLALFHFMANAFLRTYQLLISPSAVAYLISEQFYNYTEKHEKVYKGRINNMFKKMKYTFYMLSIKEWYLDYFLYKFFWKPVKFVGRKISFVSNIYVFVFLILFYITSRFLLYFQVFISPEITKLLPFLFGGIALLTIIRAFTERNNAVLAWSCILMTHFWIDLAVSFNERFTFEHTFLYLSGIVIAALVGFVCFLLLKQKGEKLDLTVFHGYAEHYHWQHVLFLFAMLGISGFPITTSFLGKDLIFTHIHDDQIILTLLVSFAFVMDGIATIRIYARLFMGNYRHHMSENKNHEPKTKSELSEVNH